MNRFDEEGVAPKATRRVFARGIAAGAVGGLLPVLAWSAPTLVEESDETAVQLGYKKDTRTVDDKRWPKHAKTQKCVNCALWQGAAADPAAGCAMFGRKHIAAEGWCMAWVAKPAG